MVRLPGYAERKPGELSGGQRQRVALARAIVNRPEVLLLDEPLGALDLKLREQMQVELKTIQGEVGITFVYVTHDQDEALTMSDRIAVFNEGRIEQVSPPRRALRAAGERVRRRLRRRLQPARARRQAASRSARRRSSCSSRAPTPTGSTPSAAGSSEVAYAGMVTRYTVALEARRRASAGPTELGGSVRGGRTRAGEGGVWWAGARSTRSPSRGSQLPRRIHHEEKGRTSRPHGVARHRRPGRVHARCSPAAAPSDDDGGGGSEACRRSAKARARST